MMVWVVGKKSIESSTGSWAVLRCDSVGQRAKVGVTSWIVRGFKDRCAGGSGAEAWARGRGPVHIRARGGTAGQEDYAPSKGAHRPLLRYSEQTVDGEITCGAYASLALPESVPSFHDNGLAVGFCRILGVFPAGLSPCRRGRVFFEFAVEGLAVKPETMGSAGFVAPLHLEDTLDVLTL